ncbi:MAG: TolC family protein [Pseudomonadota bacterium]
MASCAPWAAELGSDVAALLDYARRNNPGYAAMRLEAEAAVERVYPAGALPDLMLRTEFQNITNYDMATGSSSGVNLLPGRVGSTRYTFMQPLPFWGKRDLRLDAARAEADAAQGRAGASWAELAARIKTAFVQYFYVSHSERLTREVLGLVERLEKTAQVRYASGLTPQQDAIRAQVEQTRMRAERVALEAEKRQIQARLNGLLSRPAFAPLAEPQALRPLPPPARLDPVALAERLAAGNPQLATEEARLRAAEKERELVWRNRYPDFTLGVTPIQTRSRFKEWDLMLEMNLPLQQESRRAQEREAEIMLAAARARHEAAANQALSELAEQLAGLEAARRTERLIGANLLPQAELTFQSALAAYETGRVDFATLLDAQREISRARQERLRAQAEAQMRLAEIERLLGAEL